jgi:DNA-binding transcriptional LysR family regulator
MKTQLEHWRVLDAVVTHGGVSQAGMHLHRTQSAISYSLKQLEERAGIALLELTGRKLQLTAAGHQLLQEARQILQRMALLDQQASLLAQGIESSLVIAIEQIAPLAPILSVLQQIQQRYPHINVHWHDVVLSETDTALIRYDADLMISAHVPVNHTGQPLCEVTLIAVASPEHPLHQLGQLSLSDLTAYTQAVIRDKGQARRDIGWLASPKRWTVDHVALAHQLVKAGLAYAWLPLHIVEADCQQGVLKALLLEEGSKQQASLQLVLNPNKPHGEVVHALKAALTDSNLKKRGVCQCD